MVHLLAREKLKEKREEDKSFATFLDNSIVRIEEGWNSKGRKYGESSEKSKKSKKGKKIEPEEKMNSGTQHGKKESCVQRTKRKTENSHAQCARNKHVGQKTINRKMDGSQKHRPALHARHKNKLKFK